MKIESVVNQYQIQVTSRPGGPENGGQNKVVTPNKDAKGPDAKESVPPEKIDKAVREINSYMQKVQRNLEFSVDKETKQVVVKVIDAESGEVVRQIPAESVLEMARNLKSDRGLLFAQRA